MLKTIVSDIDLENGTPQHEETTSEKLFRHLFGACNILRGPLEEKRGRVLYAQGEGR